MARFSIVASAACNNAVESPSPSHGEALRPSNTTLVRSGHGGNGWSRDVLAHQIQTRLHERSGQAVSNFAATLPPSDSDLAQQLTKYPYVFDFVAMTDRSRERELEALLVKHVQKFLLELGQGFVFVGEQVRLVIRVEEFYADLLLCRATSLPADMSLWN